MLSSLFLLSCALLLLSASIRGSPLIGNVLNGAAPGLPNITPVLSSNTYDYIVVGAGTGGLTVASRLSESGDSVLVIEAGFDIDFSIINNELSATPGGDVIGAGSSATDLLQNGIDWEFFTAPQRGANNRKVRYARGKCSGGSSQRNFMIYQRPTVGSMQSWQRLTGDDSWGFRERLDDFKKSMTFTPPRHDLRQEEPQAQFDPSDFHTGADSASSSPLSISYPNMPQNFSKYMQLSANELGVETVRSFNGGSLLGVQYGTATISPTRGRRSTSRSFYTAARGRRNFKAFFQTYAKRILFREVNRRKRATGVVISTNPGGRGASSVVYARKEIIVSAGAFQSPQLLMVSGIGPQSELDKFNIPPIAINENVGRNLQDHVFVGPTYPVDPATKTFTDLSADPIQLAAQLVNFTVNQLGPLTNNVADLLAWEKVSADDIGGPSPLDDYPADWPVLEALSAPGVVGDFANLFVQNAAAGADGSRFATILFALVAPLSRGQITLSSADTADPPIIDPAWLTDPVDQRVALYAFKRARQYFATKAMQPIRKGAEYLPGPSVQSDADILDWIRNNLMTVWHAACTCSMRTKENGGVLDNRLRVYDVDALRVVDAAAFPMLPPGHPQSVIYMLAERAATLIKEDNA